MDNSKAAVCLAIVYACIVQLIGAISLDSECNISKGCFYECTSSSDCAFLVSWIDSGDSVNYTLISAKVGRGNFWMAIGFSDDHTMGNDSVTGCKNENGVTTVFNAKNRIKGAPDMLNNEGIELIDSSVVGTTFSCTFSRLKAAGITIDRFDLNQPWYLLFAKGDIRKSALGFHGPYNMFYSEVKFAPAFKPTPAEITTPVPTQPSEVTTQPSEVTTQPSEVTTQPSEVTTSITTQPSEVTTSPPYSSTVIKVQGCGVTVGCYSDCVGLKCSFIISWNVNESNAVYTLTSTVARTSAKWIAVGFSSDNLMGNDDVMGCVSDTSGNVVLFTARNTKHSSPIMYKDTEIKLTAQKSEDGVLSCTFLRPIAASGDERVNIDEPWTLLFAKGPGKISSSGQATVMYHKSDYHVSALSLKVSDLVDLGAKFIEYPLVKVHGSLMIVAWIFLASVGIIIARYYKPVFIHEVCSQKAWFLAHRICMMLVFCATAAGFIIIFVEVNGYSKIMESKTFLKGHPIIGIIVMILTFLNPVMAMFRPHPGTPKRPIFNWAHWFVGTSAHFLGVVNIFFGVMLIKANVPFYLVYILVAYASWQIFVELLLEIIKFLGKRQDNCEVYAICSKDGPGDGLAVDSTRIIFVKRIILGVHFFIVAAFAVTLIVLLDLGNEKLATY